METMFKFVRSGRHIIVLRLGIPEVDIICVDPLAAKQFEKYLKKTIPNDYHEYIQTYNIDHDVDTMEYLFNLFKLERDALSMFQRIKPVKDEESIKVPRRKSKASNCYSQFLS